MGVIEPQLRSKKAGEIKCPICGVSVRMDRFQEHIAKMHPKPKSTKLLRRALALCPSQVTSQTRRERQAAEQQRLFAEQERESERQAALFPTKAVHTSDYTHCRRCGLRILKTALSDHMQMSCKKRGVGPAATTPWSGLSYEAHWKPW